MCNVQTADDGKGLREERVSSRALAPGAATAPGSAAGHTGGGHSRPPCTSLAFSFSPR